MSQTVASTQRASLASGGSGPVGATHPVVPPDREPVAARIAPKPGFVSSVAEINEVRFADPERIPRLLASRKRRTGWPA